MGNHTYLSLWLEDPSENGLLENFQRFLGTVPFSRQRPGFTELVIRAISPAESPLVERDLRAAGADAGAVAAMIAEQFHSDCSCEGGAWWDLWTYEMDGTIEGGAWKLRAQPLLIVCNGEEYDEGIAGEAGHIQTDAGFEHFFTAYAGPPGAEGMVAFGSNADGGINGVTGTTAEQRGMDSGADAVEPRYVATMTQEGHQNLYHEKTAANARALKDWAERARGALHVKRLRLWSEGKENFEARLEETLAAG